MENDSIEGVCMRCGGDWVHSCGEDSQPYFLCVSCGSTDVHVYNWRLRPIDWGAGDFVSRSEHCSQMEM